MRKNGSSAEQWLVEQQHARLGNERARQCHALLLAAREFAGLAVGQVAHRHPLQQVARALLPFGLACAFHLEAEGHVVHRREVREQRKALEHHRRAARGGGQVGDVAVVQQDVAAGDRLMPRNHPQRGALAATWTGPAGSSSCRSQCAGRSGRPRAVCRRRSACSGQQFQRRRAEAWRRQSLAGAAHGKRSKNEHAGVKHAPCHLGANAPSAGPVQQAGAQQALLGEQLGLAELSLPSAQVPNRPASEPTGSAAAASPRNTSPTTMTAGLASPASAMQACSRSSVVATWRCCGRLAC